MADGRLGVGPLMFEDSALFAEPVVQEDFRLVSMTVDIVLAAKMGVCLKEEIFSVYQLNSSKGCLVTVVKCGYLVEKNEEDFSTQRSNCNLQVDSLKNRLGIRSTRVPSDCFA